ncbi:MAG TPA: MoxR family ATPase, partial [Xanthobacteraceae bacterium]
ASVSAVTTTEQLSMLQRECRTGYVDPSLVQYAVRLVAATRNPDKYNVPNVAKYLTYGASPRATIHLVEGARALAFLRGRTYVLPEDMSDIAPDVLRHRLSLSYEALSDGMSADQLIHRLMKHLPAPERPLDTHVKVDANA